MSAVKEIREKVIAEVETQAPVLEADFMDQFKKEIYRNLYKKMQEALKSKS